VARISTGGAVVVDDGDVVGGAFDVEAAAYAGEFGEARG